MNTTLTETRSASCSVVALALAALAAGLLLLIAPAARAGASFRPISYQLTDDKLARWAVVLKRAPVHSAPRLSSRVVTTLSTMTSDDTQNIVLTLDAKQPTEKQ